jgi:hypothetical protein
MYCYNTNAVYSLSGFRGATAARLTPDQEVACSNHVEINLPFNYKGYYSTYPCKFFFFFFF